MASPFKIPKKKQTAAADSAPLHSSPLSRLQSPAQEVKSYGGQSSRGRADRMHAGNSSSNRQSDPVFRNTVRSLLGLNSPNTGASANHRGASAANHRGASAANHRGASAANHRAGWSSQSQPGHNGWRPKRASDRLLLPAETSESPPQKKTSEQDEPPHPASTSISVDSLDSLAELRGQGHDGTLSSPTVTKRPWRRRDAAEAKSSSPSGSDRTSEDDFLSPPTDKRRRSLDRTAVSGRRSLDRTAVSGRRSLDRTAVSGRRSLDWTAVSGRRSLDQTAVSGRRSLDRTAVSGRRSLDRTAVSGRRSLDRTAVSGRWSLDRTAVSGRRSLDRTAVSGRWSLDQTAVSGRRSLDRTAGLPGDLREKETEFRERKTTDLHHRLKKPRHTEPIVLSSEEEEEEEEEEDEEEEEEEKEEEGDRDGGGRRTSHRRVEESQQNQAQQTDERVAAPPSFLQLDFTSLHAGLTHANANGRMMITENGITIPLTGAEDGDVTVVASQVRGYGVWDGGVAQGGSLLAAWKGPAPSLLFLWVTDAQANLLQKELSSIQTPIQTPIQTSIQTPIQTPIQAPIQTSIQTSIQTCPPCSVLLLVLKEQLQELQAALLNSILDMEEYRRGCSSSDGPTSPLDWTDGLLLLHSCPPPLDQHLLGLLGHSAMGTNQKTRKTNLNSSGRQQLPTRLIQYPVAPCKGRITVAKEDLACLGNGEFLNDVIIDFYLKFLLLEGVGGSMADRSHIFSSFFYKQLSRRRATGEDDAPAVPDRHMRHQRVKTWTRHVDLFTKDFLFVPVNREAHWFLVVVCFPGLEEVQYQDFHSPTGGSERAAGKPPSFGLRSQQPPEVTERSCQRDTVLKRPCVLVMDSLKLSHHDNVCRLLRDYLQVEWEVRRGTPRLFTSDNMRTSVCRVPQQDNSSDCGLYLLQYAESFLQNPVVHFDLPLRLDNWFPRQRVRQKREEIRSLIMRLHQSQTGDS